MGARAGIDSGRKHSGPGWTMLLILTDIAYVYPPQLISHLELYQGLMNVLAGHSESTTIMTLFSSPLHHSGVS